MARGGTVIHDWTETSDDTKIRSIRVEELFDTRVGSETTWVRLKDETTDTSFEYRGVEGTKKSILKSPTKNNLGELDTKLLHKVRNKLSKRAWLELGGL